MKDAELPIRPGPEAGGQSACGGKGGGKFPAATSEATIEATSEDTSEDTGDTSGEATSQDAFTGVCGDEAFVFLED